jgi:hypothetical protein
MSSLSEFGAFILGAVPGGANGRPVKAGAAPARPGHKTFGKKLSDLTDEKIEEMIGDPQKRLEELAEWNVPRYSEEFKDDTPQIQFLVDLKTGTKKVEDYIKFINEQLEHAEKYGSLVGLDRIPTAAKGLKKITGKLSSGLGQAGKVINQVKQAVEWIHAADAFADDTIAMDPKDRESVKRWVGSMKRLWNATAPFAEWAQNKAAVAAIAEGSQAGAALSATFAIVGAQLYVGLAVLDKGVKVVSAYYDRYDSIMKEIDRNSANPPPEPPPPDLPPDDWVSREDRAQQAVADEDQALRNKIHAAQREEKRQEQEARERPVKEATENFAKNMFPTIYMKHRPEIRKKIRAALGSEGGTFDPHVDRDNEAWWACLTPTESNVEADSTIEETKESVSKAEAIEEIRRFNELSKPCPYFKDLHDRALKMYLINKVGAAR